MTAIRVLRLIEHTFDSPEAFAATQGRWIEGVRRFSTHETIRATTLPIDILPDLVSVAPPGPPAVPSSFAEISVTQVGKWLRLVNERATVLAGPIRDWDQATRYEVVTYCAAVHFSASDNADIVVPPKPSVLT